MELWLKIISGSSVTAAIVTAVWNGVLRHRDRKEMRSATIQAILAEIEQARRFAVSYLAPKAVRSPMHRISTVLYRHCVSKLIEVGALTTESTDALLVYYQNIEQMNRSLDLMMELGKSGKVAEQIAESRRAYYKAASLVPVREMRQLVDEPARFQPLQVRTIRKKLAIYRGASPYDRVCLSLGN